MFSYVKNCYIGVCSRLTSFQGLLFSSPDCLKVPLDLIRLWVHEGYRVYRDKLIDLKDMELFDKILKETVKKVFEEVPDADVFAQPLLFCHFVAGIGDPKYLPVTDMNDLNKLLVDALDNYNEINAVMNLVLFEDAIAHILRINRILESPRGNALLVGVGGSGKQSLSRLAAFISTLEVFQITLRKGYGIPDLKIDLSLLYSKAGVKGIGIVLLMTDAQVADEKFLVLINDLLASGEIPDLFPDDEVENIINALRGEVKAMGIFDSKENCWKYFIDKVRKQLKVGVEQMQFSPSVLTLLFILCNCNEIALAHVWLYSIIYLFIYYLFVVRYTVF